MNSYCPECHSTFNRGAGICPHDDTELIPAEDRDDPYAGEVLDDRYRLESLLGAGGMGMVYRSTQLAVDRNVAVKLLRDELDADSQAHERFSREAQHISSLNHPNIVQLIDFGRDRELDSWFLVMEHVEGRSLADLLEGGRLDWELALEIVYQVCGALAASHEREMVHRDLKPDNLHLVPVADGTLQVKVLDFGIARCLEQTTKLTESGMVCGTPAYLAPEQANGSAISTQTDLYALGICLYEMVTGRLPFDADSAVPLMIEHVSETPAPIEGHLPAEDPVDQLQSLLDDMLAKKPDDRPESAREVRSRVEAIRESRGRPLHGLAGDYDWGRQLDEMVHPRIESEDDSDRELADRRTVDPLAMTAGTMETLHPTFKKFDRATTREWSGTNERAAPKTNPGVEGRDGAPIASNADSGLPSPSAPERPAAGVSKGDSDARAPSDGKPVDRAPSDEKPAAESTAGPASLGETGDRSYLAVSAAGLAILAVVLGGLAISLSGTDNGTTFAGTVDAGLEADGTSPAADRSDGVAVGPDRDDVGRADAAAVVDDASADTGEAHRSRRPEAAGSGGGSESGRAPAEGRSAEESTAEESSLESGAVETASPDGEGAGAAPRDPDDDEVESPDGPPETPPSDDDPSDGTSLEKMLEEGSLRSE